METRIIILNYNGREFLPQCLPSIVNAAAKSRHNTRVTLLDNLSQDEGVSYVRHHFPQIEIAVAPENKILCSYNDFLTRVQEPVVILLNNDIRVDESFVDPLLQKFEEDSLTFLAAPKVMSFDGAAIEAVKTKGGMRYGLFWSSARYPGHEKEADTSSETLSSGFGAFSRKKFLMLGGYDERYLPGIMEDADLCLRAKRAGFRLYYEPRSIVYHMGQASFKKRFGSRRIEVLAHRNNFLFMWKNFSGFKFWLSHLFFLPLRILFSLLKGSTSLAEGFWQAFSVKKQRQ